MMELCVLGVFILMSTVSAMCPNGWMRYDDSCYFFEDIQKEPWHVAFNYCNTMDADLVRIDTARENNFLKAELHKLHPDSEDQFWTAGNDIQVEKDWVWAGSQLGDRITGFTDWASGEPNSVNGEEDCLSFYPRKGYQWNDEHCDKSMYFICEHPDPLDGGEIVG